jgi:hypothetical protein
MDDKAVLARHTLSQQASASETGVRSQRIIRWDPDLDPDCGDMEFRLTYAGPLLSARDTAPRNKRSDHVHAIRRVIHRQLKELWGNHPVLAEIREFGQKHPGYRTYGVNEGNGFNWLPMVTEANGLICKLDILMLRHGPPGEVLHDVDNRLKTLFDALRMARSPDELGARIGPQFVPEADENPFYVLLEDDRLITHVSVTTDMLLEPVDDVPADQAVRLVINVTARPYRTYSENLEFV